jgi:hypothetical protein
MAGIDLFEEIAESFQTYGGTSSVLSRCGKRRMARECDIGLVAETTPIKSVAIKINLT